MTFDPTSVEVTCVSLPKDHCVPVSWEYINVCGYSDQFCKLPHTYTYIHTYYIQDEWSHSLFLNSVQARQKGSVKQTKAIVHMNVEKTVFTLLKCGIMLKNWMMIRTLWGGEPPKQWKLILLRQYGLLFLQWAILLRQLFIIIVSWNRWFKQGDVVGKTFLKVTKIRMHKRLSPGLKLVPD